MEKSMKHAEKLVQATNSALAQMKLSMMFDDLGGKRGFQRREGGVEGEDLLQCQEEFRLEAKEMLMKMEKMLGPGDANKRNVKVVERIKEINRNMSILKQEQGRMGEQSREKLLSLLGEERLSPGKSSGRGSVGTGPCKKEKERLVCGQSPLKTKEELQSNMLEMRDIVDRGFQTARQLAQKVENLKRNERREKTPRVEGDKREMMLRCLDGKSEKVMGVREEREENVGGGGGVGVGVVEVRRSEGDEGGRRSRLRVQRLPSMVIRGGLQVQRVHRLEIGGERVGRGQGNTGVHFVCHEQLEKGRLERVLEGVQRENVCWVGGGKGAEVGVGAGMEVEGGRWVECSGCGKVMRVEERWLDPRGVEEVLRKCNFNVFDPRIDEFVEKWRGINGRKWKEGEKEGRGVKRSSEEEMKRGGGKVEDKEEGQGGEEEEGMGKGKGKKREGGSQRVGRGVSVEYLSKRVTRGYREEAETLEGNHLKLDNLLRRLLRKIDESREVLEGCNLFSGERVERGRALTASKAVVVNVAGSCVKSRRKQKKLDKKDVRNRSKSRTTRSPEGKGDRRDVRAADGKRIPVEMEGTMTLSARESDGGGEVRREGEEGKGQFSSRRCSGKCWNSGQGRKAESRKGSTEEALRVQEEDEKSGEREREGEAMSSGGKSDSLKLFQVREDGKTGTASNETGSCCSEGRVDEVIGGDGGMFSWANERENSRAWEVKEGGEKENGLVCVGNEAKVPSDESSERSEKDYESDFESTTNEAEGEGECEEPEVEVFPIGSKLSTIFEEDSGLERKLSEEKKTQRDSVISEAQKERSEPSEESDIRKQQQSSEDIWKAENSPSRTAEASLKSTPTELVTSLKDILSALKDQFARTETLAEKLTQNAKQDKSKKEGMLSPWRTSVPEKLMEDLGNARKVVIGEGKGVGAVGGLDGGDGWSAESLSEEGGSSLGEVVMGRRRREGLGKCESSSGSESSFMKLGRSVESSRASSGQRGSKKKSRLGLNVESEEISYSEGEVEGNPLAESEWCSSHSVGEIRDQKL